MECDDSAGEPCLGRREFLVKAGLFAGAAVLTVSWAGQAEAASKFEDVTIAVGPDSPLAKAGGSVVVDSSAGKIIVIRNADAKFAAFSAVCTHKRGLLSYDGKQLSCPKHGSKFDIADGRVTSGPAETGLKSFPVKNADGSVLVTVA